MSDTQASGPEVPDWFTPSGDTGRTTFGLHGEIVKHDPRPVAYGECAEANASLGVAVAVGQLPVDVNGLLTSIQNDLLDIAADLFVPLDSTEPAEARVSSSYVSRLERAVLHYAAEVGEPDTRVLPGGTAAAALLYLARNVVRRAERAVWLAVEAYPATVSAVPAQYLNRLATLLLLLARVANAEHGNLAWEPGASAHAMSEETSRPDEETGQDDT